ncbi:MAG: MotA/TolQ/ExbB proton channel family protein [Armatimonadetes bacterium]|nr:MotA/TolQ/ExbB proton channel family protein [Armatimonadota bacterium]
MFELLKHGGIVMYPLGLCSLLTIAVTLERLFVFFKVDCNIEEALAWAKAVLAGEKDAMNWLKHPGPANRAMEVLINSRGEPREVLENRLQTVLGEENLRLNSYLGIVGTIGSIAPFIGLFGTVLGIIRAFRDIGRVGAAGPAVVATGISEALVATAAGLFVAIIAVIAYNAFVIWQRRILHREEIAGLELLDLLVSNGKDAAERLEYKTRK